MHISGLSKERSDATIMIGCTFSILFFLYCLERYFGLYGVIWEFDSFMHIVGGMFAGSVGIYFQTVVKGGRYYLFAIISAIIIGALWEIVYEFHFLGETYPWGDTTVDMIMDAIGGAIIAWYFIKKQKKGLS